MRVGLKVNWFDLVALLGVVVTVVLIFTSSLGFPPLRFSPVRLRQGNLRSIAAMMKNYAIEHDDQFIVPSSFQMVMDWADIPYPEPILGSDDTQDDIWMCPIPWPDRRIPDGIRPEELAKLPMLHERVDMNPEGASVLFWDGHVELLSNKDFERLIDVDQSVCLGCQLLIPKSMKNRKP